MPQQNYTHEVNNDEMSLQQEQRPNNLRGEVYYNFHDGQYRLLHNHERISPQSVIYHEGRDQCFYFSKEQTWKSALLVDFPENTVCYLYRSGPLQLPDWPQISHLIMTPSPTGSPHVSFPPLAFKPIRPSGNSPTGMMMPHPTPIQPQNPIRQQMPFSTFQYPFAFETQQQYGPHQATQQDIWSNAYLPNIFPPMQQTPVRHPTFNTPLWTNPTQPHATEHQNSFQSNVTQTQPKEIST